MTSGGVVFKLREALACGLATGLLTRLAFCSLCSPAGSKDSISTRSKTQCAGLDIAGFAGCGLSTVFGR